MKRGLGDMMKQAQAMQESMQKAQEELAATEVRGQSGGGLVTVTMTCRYAARRIDIDPALFEDDREVLEDLVVAAVNDAVRKIEAATEEKMSGLTAGLNLPGLSGLKLPL
ncbi:MAG: YbaB/EbfC family nucleoid-associated protein [Gammaproteobacteria bacterium]|nr:YbaB/EbfC family nucleoid-associated protein [Gammaproteobacteria bacterium]MDD9821443.1 YbaB/EbfC family nucleoid-associated protein [Gammaproteobacteria bacterium]MDD9855908.1 YbaB/EbfC family nucleoid-associated protein [Gammaproteobacteria bacterium]MDD9883842.1 YbaB/EbfC family nucleoid-associated protein [Gammaproteobacteria bacterium]